VTRDYLCRGCGTAFTGYSYDEYTLRWCDDCRDVGERRD